MPRRANTSRATSSPHATISARASSRASPLSSGSISASDVASPGPRSSASAASTRGSQVARGGGWSITPKCTRRGLLRHLRLEPRDLLADEPLAELWNDFPHDRLDALQDL